MPLLLSVINRIKNENYRWLSKNILILILDSKQECMLYNRGLNGFLDS